MQPEEKSQKSQDFLIEEKRKFYSFKVNRKGEKNEQKNSLKNRETCVPAFKFQKDNFKKFGFQFNVDSG